MNDKPFVLHGGESRQSSLHNRVNAIARIKYISNVDLSHKSEDYLYALDLEMYQRWYKDESKDIKINEVWCQRAAEVIKAMESTPLKSDNLAVKEAFNQYKNKEIKNERK